MIPFLNRLGPRRSHPTPDAPSPRISVEGVVRVDGVDLILHNDGASGEFRVRVVGVVRTGDGDRVAGRGDRWPWTLPCDDRSETCRLDAGGSVVLRFVRYAREDGVDVFVFGGDLHRLPAATDDGGIDQSSLRVRFRIDRLTSPSAPWIGEWLIEYRPVTLA